MISVTKSPNMMSTTGRMPVMAAPRPSPAMPASEIGESTIRSVPNSSTRPARTLNGVPASATSSPITKTVGSRRSSSAIASWTACASVSSRTPAVVEALSVDILGHLARLRERRRQGVLDRRRDLGLDRRPHALHLVVIERQLPCEERDRIALADPALLLVLRAVVAAIDVADVMAVIAVGGAHEEARAVAGATAPDGAGGCVVDREDVLSVDLDGRDSEGLGPRGKRAGRHVEVARVLVVEVVLADVDHGELPDRRHVHHLVEQPLSEGALAEEADRDAVGAESLRRERGAGGDPGGAADDRVRAEVAVRVIRNVHRATLAAAVALLASEQLAVHAPDVRALGDAVPVPAVRRGDGVVLPERRADADGDGLLADVEVREARHLRRQVELVRLHLERADAKHPLEHLAPELGIDLRAGPCFDRHQGRVDRLVTVVSSLPASLQSSSSSRSTRLM